MYVTLQVKQIIREDDMVESRALGEARRVALNREGRRNAILDAAESLFLELGFEGTTLGAVVGRSGGSLATLYSEFGNKLNLLRAVVERMREQAPDIATLREQGSSPREVLRELAHRFHRFVMNERTLAFMRVVIAQSLADPEFGQAFHHDIRLQVVGRLAETLEQWTREGKARIDDPIAVAELYFAALMCDAPLKAMLGLPVEPTDDAVLDWRIEPLLRHFAIAG
jgi:AcrR family transcriptional regulator